MHLDFFVWTICKIRIWIYLPTTQMFGHILRCADDVIHSWHCIFNQSVLPSDYSFIKMANCPTWLFHERTSIWSAGWVMMAHNFIPICCSGVSAQQETTYGLKGSGFEEGVCLPGLPLQAVHSLCTDWLVSDAHMPAQNPLHMSCRLAFAVVWSWGGCCLIRESAAWRAGDGDD